ncbi:MAG: class I SAM-dependent methyltransferase [Myxococcota bacterium]
MNLFQSLRGAVKRTRGVSEEEFKKWRRESTDPVVRSGACYVPIPGKENIRLYQDKQNLHHLGRYEWASAILRSQPKAETRVLDCACGVGYGSARLAEFAKSVDAVDSFRHAVLRAESRYPRSNLTFHHLDAFDIRSRFEDESFTTIVSFQTIECLEDDGKFLDDAYALLKPGGQLLIDTPTRNRTVAKPANKHQRRNYSVEEWLDLLLERFDRVNAFDTLPKIEVLRKYDFPSNGGIVQCTKSAP